MTILTSPGHPDCGGTGLIGRKGELLGVGTLFIQHKTIGDEVVDGNMVVPIEQHVEWINDCISYMKNNNIDYLEAGKRSMENWTKHVNDVANETLFIHAKKSWYYGANIPGKPRGFMPYAGGMARYKAICNYVANQNYLGFKFSNSDKEETFIPSKISVDILIKDLMTNKNS